MAGDKPRAVFHGSKKRLEHSDILKTRNRGGRQILPITAQIRERDQLSI
jgi:hypothetical protein